MLIYGICENHMEWIVTWGMAGFMQEKKCLWLEISSWGNKGMWRQNHRLSTGNRLRLRKTKIKRDLPKGWNAFKSMQITDKGKWIGWKHKIMCFRAREKIRYREEKLLKSAYILIYKSSKNTNWLQNVQIMYSQNNNWANNVKWASTKKKIQRHLG